MTSNNIKEKLWKKDYIIMMIAACGISITTHLFLSTLPIYAELISNTMKYTGFMTGAYTLAALAIRPFAGMLVDRTGRTMFLIFSALLCSIVIFSYNFAGSVFLLILLRIFNGFGFGIHTTASGAVAADVIPKSRLMEGMGYYGLYGTIGFAIGPAIGLSIIGEGNVDRFKILFITGALIAVFSMIMDTCITYERKRKKAPINNIVDETEQKQQAVSIRDLSEDERKNLPGTFLGFEHAVFLPASILLLAFLAQSSVMSFIALYAYEFSIGNVGLFFTFFALGMFLSRIVSGRVGDIRGPNVIVIPAIVLLIICYFIIPFIRTLIPLLLLSFPIGLSLGAITPMINALIVRRCSKYRKGTASAAYFSAIDIGIGVGSIVFGFIIAAFSYRFMYFSASFSCVLALSIYILFVSGKEKVSKTRNKNNGII